MKRLLMVAMISVCAAPGAFAANGTWTGKISDSKCGFSHKAAILHGGGKMTNAQCTEACVKGGGEVRVHVGRKGVRAGQPGRRGSRSARGEGWPVRASADHELAQGETAKGIVKQFPDKFSGTSTAITSR